MLKAVMIVLIVVLNAQMICADSNVGGSLMPGGIRAIPTPDDCAIIIVSDLTDGTGTGLQWLGVDGAISCNADNSIIVWTGGYLPQMSPPPPPPISIAPNLMPHPPTAPQIPAVQSNQEFLWPEGIDNAMPFDLDNSIILKGREGDLPRMYAQ